MVGAYTVSRISIAVLILQKKGMKRARSPTAVSPPANRQCAFMREHHEVATEIGHGVNFKRPGLLSILERSREGGISEVVVAHRGPLLTR